MLRIYFPLKMSGDAEMENWTKMDLRNIYSIFIPRMSTITEEQINKTN